MSNIDKQAREELRKRYTPPEIPKCSICGAELSIQHCGGSEPTVYACDGYEADPENPGMVRLAAGRGIADSHYEKSRYIDWKQGGDSDVVALLDELEAADALNKHLELAIRKAEGCSEALRRKTEAAENRVAELEAREVKFTLRPELTAEDCDILARSIDYGTGWNLALSSCEEEFIRALTSAGIRINGEG